MEIREYLKARSLNGLKPVDIHREVYTIYGEGQIGLFADAWLSLRPANGDLKYAAPSGRSPTTTKSNIKKSTDLLNQDARYTVRDLAQSANFSLAKVYGILRKNLKLRKINARWMSQLLTDEQERSRVLNAT